MPGCTLVMDTSSSPLLVALEKDGKVFSARRAGIKQEKLLFPLLRKLLANAHAALPDISRVLIIRGPGRFTGIRIALTFASMMRMLNHTQVLGVTLFDVLAAQARCTRAYQTWKRQHPQGAVAVVLHAFREEYFLQMIDDTHAAPQWLSREELLKQLAAYPQELFVVGTDKNFEPLDALLNGAYALAPYRACRVQVRMLLRFTQKNIGEENALEPLYLKPARFELEGAK